MNSDELRSSQTNSLTSPVSLPLANNGFEAVVPHTNKMCGKCQALRKRLIIVFSLKTESLS